MLRLAKGHLIVTVPAALLLLLITILSVWINPLAILAGVMLAGFLFLLFFFRDPERFSEDDDHFGILSPADGTVYAIEKSEDNLILRIRMSILDVHVNRMPISGTITSILREKGSHWPMIPGLTRSSLRNARQHFLVRTDLGMITITQISGFFAWRCVSYHSKNSYVERGARLGIVRFGSEVVLTLPASSAQIRVGKGVHATAGVTVLASYSQEPVVESI
jgi:phosphatidylserine decarboxylase